MEIQLKRYLTDMLPKPKSWAIRLQQQAARDNIPIMDSLSMNFLMQLVRIQKPERILEIGTAIGYSALMMLDAHPNAWIVTIARGAMRFKQARETIDNMQMQNQIRLIYGDAVNIVQSRPDETPLDLILIDAAKGHYQNFFKLASPYLAKNGVIISDNVLFKGYVAGTANPHARYEKIAQKMHSYNNWLVQQPDFTTTIVSIGDGLAISVKHSDTEA